MTNLASLSDRRVLVVEDEPFIALDIADAVETLGGDVIGPAMTVRQALEIIIGQKIDAAILDVNLPDGDVGPVIEALADKTNIIVIHTGAGLPDMLKKAYPHLHIYNKPTPPQLLASKIAAELSAAAKL